MIAVLALLMITYFVTGALSGDSEDTTPQETAPSYPVADVSPDGVERITMTVKYLVGGKAKSIPLYELDWQKEYDYTSAVAIEEVDLLKKQRFTLLSREQQSGILTV